MTDIWTDVGEALAEQQDHDDSTWADQEWRERQQLEDEAEVAAIRQQKRIKELWEMQNDPAAAFDDPHWEEGYQRAKLHLDSALRGMFMAGVREGVAMFERRADER